MLTRLCCWAMALVWATAAASAAPASASRPNIVLIMIDDMGYGDIGPFGAKKNRTPNLDRMAEQGMKLTSFYAAPVCSVSRAQVITGCYGARVSIPGVFFPSGPQGLNASEHTVAELLKSRGYATMCIGKWHLGDQPEFLPTRHGFDHYLGIPYSNDMHRKSKESGKQVVPLLQEDKVLELLDAAGQERVVERYTEAAEKFIRDHREGPFFLYLPHTAVHVPVHPGARFQGKSANGRYGDWVEEVDWSVGRVLDTLRELKLDRNTLVIFTSDNGPWLTKGADGGEAGRLRGGKGSTWEGGVRVPTLAWWPGRIASGSTCDRIAGNIDFLPTFVSLAGGTVPSDRQIDGRDISPLLLGAKDAAGRDAHYYYNGYRLEAVRQGPWKLAIGPQASGLGMPFPESTNSNLRLYNLESDIGEQTDLAAAHPDIVQRLQALAARMAAELGNGKPGPAVRPAGTAANPQMLYPAEAPAQTPKAQAGKKGNVKFPAPTLSQLQPGEAIASADAPKIARQPLTIRCEVEPKSPNGVIVAHGGTSAGYALHLERGTVSFSIRTTAEEVTTIKSKEAPKGRFQVEARLEQDGTMLLLINGKQAAAARAPGLIPRQPAENLCVGDDDGMPVTAYQGSPRFSGTIQKLEVVTGKRP